MAAIPLSYYGDYQRWLRLGMCLRNLDDIGLGLWDEASQKCPKYRPGECRKSGTPSIPSGKLAYRTALALAKDNGWKPPARKGREAGEQSRPRYRAGRFGIAG
ncbi:MAG: PriCT-2 domain-containing protein [Singulisphaera sp.]